MRPRPPKSPPPPASSGSATARPRVLVVDDDPSICEGLRIMLQRTLDVTIAQSGEEALELLAAGAKYELVLCDLHMHATTGLDVLAAVAARGDGARLALMTGSTLDATARATLARLGAPVLEKPFRPDDVSALFDAPPPRRG